MTQHKMKTTSVQIRLVFCVRYWISQSQERFTYTAPDVIKPVSAASRFPSVCKSKLYQAAAVYSSDMWLIVILPASLLSTYGPSLPAPAASLSHLVRYRFPLGARFLT